MYKQKKQVIIQKTRKVFELIKEREHVYIGGSYQNRSSILTIWCSIHLNEHTTSFWNYERSKTGCPCCGKDLVSKKLKNRKFSEKTLKLMSQSALERPLRGGQSRRWREDHIYRKWRQKVFEAYQNNCAITGKEKISNGDLVAHHLYGANNFPNLVYSVENGIVLYKEIYEKFHLKYGYTKNTLDQFLEFIEFMLISSQDEKLSQGSETRASLIELQERLMKLKNYFSSMI
jgi:hypothetical protein